MASADSFPRLLSPELFIGDCFGREQATQRFPAQCEFSVRAIEKRAIFFRSLWAQDARIYTGKVDMGITFRVDQERKLLLSKAEGNVTYEEAYNHLVEERKAMGLSYPEIIDARTATPAVAAGEVRALVMFLRGLGFVHDIGPTAFVVGTPVAFGVIRMAGALCEDVCAIAPFWSLEEAEAWIAKGAPVHSDVS
jgi:hypothetical protein